MSRYISATTGREIHVRGSSPSGIGGNDVGPPSPLPTRAAPIGLFMSRSPGARPLQFLSPKRPDETERERRLRVREYRASVPDAPVGPAEPYPVSLLTSPRNQEIYGLWRKKGGRTVEYLARRYGLHPKTIQAIVHDERRRRATRYYNLVYMRLSDDQEIYVREPLDTPWVPPLDRPEDPRTTRKRIQERAIARRAEVWNERQRIARAVASNSDVTLSSPTSPSE